MKLSLVFLVLAALALLALPARAMELESEVALADEADWVQPAFVESLAEVDVEAEAEAEAELPAPGQKCGPALAGTCTAKAAWCKGTPRAGFCAGSALCCFAAGSSAAKPAATTPSKAATPAANTAISLQPCKRPIGPSPSKIVIPQNIIDLANKKTFAPGLRSRGVCPAGNAMTSAEVSQILTAVWKAFGATDAQAATYAARNLKQVQRESTFCPSIVQGIIKGDPNNNNPAGGLLQFIPATYNFWHVNGYAKNRFNPLSNILAAVNAQVNADCISPSKQGRVLSGVSGWTPQKGTNPFPG